MNGKSFTRGKASESVKTLTEKFRSVVLYPYPAELDGISLQGEFLYRGLKQNKFPVMPCNRFASFEKEFLYKSFKPDIAVGIGFWGDIPHLVEHPLEHGVTPVPWLNADGWVANYHDMLNGLPLILVTSNWVKETYHRDGVYNKNIFPVPIGIDTDEIRPIPKNDPRVMEMRRILGVEPHEKLILTVGGDTTSKGFQEVLKALARINPEFKDWVYVGKSWEKFSPYYHHREEVKIIRDSNLPRNRIKYVDGPISRETVSVLLSAADIYAAPSRIEGFGMIQVEAQACGVPVLGIDAMGVKDTVVHGETGFLAKVSETIGLEEEWGYKDMGFSSKHKVKFDVPKTFAVRADVDDLAEHLLNLLTDDQLREKMSINGRRHVVENFDYRKVSLDMMNLVQSKLRI